MTRTIALLILAATFISGCQKKKNTFTISGYLYSKEDTTAHANTTFIVHHTYKKNPAFVTRKGEVEIIPFTTDGSGYFTVSVDVSNSELSICWPDYTEYSSCFYDVNIASHQSNKIAIDTLFIK